MVVSKNPHLGGVQLPLLTLETIDWCPPSEFPELEGPQAWDLETWDPNLTTMGPGWIPGGEGHIAGFSVCSDNFKGYFPIGHDTGNLDKFTVISWAKGQIKKPVPKIFANAPYDVGWMGTVGIEINPEEIHDIQLQAPLLNEYRPSYSLDNLAKIYLDRGKDVILLREALSSYGFKDVGQISRIPPVFAGPYAERDSEATRDLWLEFNKHIEKENLTQIYELERSLIPLTIAMRMKGVRVDVEKAQVLRKEMKEEQKLLLEGIKHDTGIDVDPWISQGIALALETQGIKAPFTPKTHKPSITAAWLEGYRSNHVAASILKVRQLDKAVGTFIDGHILGYARNGRVHAQFSQLRRDEDDATKMEEGKRAKGTVSGRYSSDSPNLQQIPIREPDIGWRIRDLFVADEGEEWASIDYSSQEPRLTVHFAALMKLPGAEEAVTMYRADPRTDYHQMVADICGIGRKQAKAINLGIAYGMGGPKLCRELGLPTEWIVIKDRETGEDKEIEIAGPEGQDILNRVNKNAPFIKKLFSKCTEVAEGRRFIKTILGRHCRFEYKYNRVQESHKALNRLIQGSAADQTKEAMRQLYYDHKVIPLATVHDELCFSVPNIEVARKYVHIMEHAVPLEIPVIADLKMGKSWGTVQLV